MGSLLSTKKQAVTKKENQSISEADKAVLRLKTQRRKLNAERKRIEDVIEKNIVLIKDLIATKKKDRAILALKKKKLREKQLNDIDTWLINVEQLLGNIEMSVQQNQIFSALRIGADVLKELENEVTIEDVEKLREDTEEAKEYQDRIQEALVGATFGEDESEIIKELQDLELQMLQFEDASYPRVPKEVVKEEETEPEVDKEESSRAKESPLLA